MAHRDQDEERRQHDELALGEVDRLGGLPEQREADRDERVDAAGREAGDEELEEVGQSRRPKTAAGAWSAGRPG